MYKVSLKHQWDFHQAHRGRVSPDMFSGMVLQYSFCEKFWGKWFHTTVGCGKDVQLSLKTDSISTHKNTYLRTTRKYKININDPEHIVAEA